jgi:hypothetical protein
MQQLITFLSGKKTYIIATIAAVLAFAQAMGYPIPEYIYAILGACGLATLRVAVSK